MEHLSASCKLLIYLSLRTRSTLSVRFPVVKNQWLLVVNHYGLKINMEARFAGLYL